MTLMQFPARQPSETQPFTFWITVTLKERTLTCLVTASPEKDRRAGSPDKEHYADAAKPDDMRARFSLLCPRTLRCPSRDACFSRHRQTQRPARSGRQGIGIGWSRVQVRRGSSRCVPNDMLARFACANAPEELGRNNHRCVWSWSVDSAPR